MSWVDVFAAVPDIESDLWSDIAVLGLTLDRDDFVECGYAVDEEKFPRTPGTQTTPMSTRATTRSTNTATPKVRRGKKVVEESEEEEDKESDEEEEEEEEEAGPDVMETPPLLPSQTVPGSSSSSGLPLPAGGAHTPGTPLSKSRPMKKKRKVDPLLLIAQVMADQKEDRRLARLAQEKSDMKFKMLTNAFAEEQKLNKKTQKRTTDMLQDLMSRTFIPAIASAQPSPTSQQLLLQNRHSGSIDSAVSSPRSALVGQPPLPSGPSEVDPLPPPPPVQATATVTSSVDVVEPERSAQDVPGDGHNLQEGQQEVVPPSGTDPAADPSAGCAQ